LPPRRRTASETSPTSGRHRRPGISPGQSPAPSSRDGSRSEEIKDRGVGSAWCGVAVFRSVEVNGVASTQQQPPSTVPSPPARPDRAASNTGERLLPPGTTPPTPDEAAAPDAKALRQRGRAATASPPSSLAPRRLSGGRLWRRQGRGGRGKEEAADFSKSVQAGAKKNIDQRGGMEWGWNEWKLMADVKR
jgi:hypothetical protein